MHLTDLLTNASFWTGITLFGGIVAYFYKKQSEAAVVNKAIHAEIRRLLIVLTDHHCHWLRWLKEPTTIPHRKLIPFTHVVYDKQVENIGLINSRSVEVIVEFYGYIDFLNQFQLLKEKAESSGISDDYYEQYKLSLERSFLPR